MHIWHANCARYEGLPMGRAIPTVAAKARLPIGEISTFISLDTTRLSDMMGIVPPKPIVVLNAIFGRALLDQARH
jgi:hypothetical protein